MDGETQTFPNTEGGNVETAETPDSWRNTTTQERDTIVGHKLQEVTELTACMGLYGGQDTCVHNVSWYLEVADPEERSLGHAL